MTNASALSEKKPPLVGGVVPAGAGGAIAPPDFGRSVNPISARGNRFCLPNYFWHPQIFRPSDGSEKET